MIAVQWFKNGDQVCSTCGKTLHYHGWIDQGAEGIRVCPGDYILTLAPGVYDVAKSKGRNYN